MTVEDLISRLQDFPADSPVHSYSDGLNPIEVEFVKITHDKSGEYIVLE